MDPLGFGDLDLTAEIVERQLALWNALRKAARERDQKAPSAAFRFLTIARDEGSLGDEIAQELSKRLAWHVFDKEIVTYIAKNSHVRENLVSQLDQKSQSLVQDTISRLLRMPEYGAFGSSEYHESLIKTLVYIAKHGSATLVGRGANFALREDTAWFNVRVTASPEVRVERLRQKWNVPLEEARRRMQADDEERRKFIRQYFKQDFDDARFYDLVCNTDRLPVNRIVSLVLSAMNHPETGTAG
jgi:cytidylate kinase